MSENAEIQKAQRELEKISNDEHERYLAELREKYIMDQKATEDAGYDKGKKVGLAEGIRAGLAEGKKVGIAEGKTAGRKEEKIKIAKKLLEEGINIEIISNATGLTKEEIKKI